jgi:hypothetical protein
MPASKTGQAHLEALNEDDCDEIPIFALRVRCYYKCGNFLERLYRSLPAFLRKRREPEYLWFAARC